MRYTIRPIATWPAWALVEGRRAPFKASYSASEDLLWRELDCIDAQNVVLEIDVQPSDMRLDGTLRTNARPQGPRVILYAETMHGPLTMPCGTFGRWQDNVRAIALSLEALRRVDRYGCSSRGEQYRGWTAIPASTSVSTRVEAAWRLLIDTAGLHDISPANRDREQVERLFRAAAKIAHPDAGGTAEMMAAINRARETLMAVLDA